MFASLLLFFFVNLTTQNRLVDLSVHRLADNVYSTLTNGLDVHPTESLAIKNRILEQGPSILKMHLNQANKVEKKPTAYQFARETLDDVLNDAFDHHHKDSDRLTKRYITNDFRRCIHLLEG